MVAPPAVGVSRQISWSPVELRALVDRLKDSSDRQRQVSAARELAELNRSEIHNLLLGMVGEFNDVWNFPVAAKLLLVELARRDPVAAVAWSWDNLREVKGWAHAFEQIGPQWAWDDPEGFSQFVIKHLRESSSQRDLTMKELLASSEPILSNDEANDTQLWLMKSSPSLAFQIQRLSGSSSYRAEMIETLNSKSDFESALSAWDDYDPQAESKAREAYKAASAKGNYNLIESEERATATALRRELRKLEHPSLDYTVKEIVKRWKLLDPEGFSESISAGWEMK